MKKAYIQPLLEVYSYQAEEGYKQSVALHRDYRDVQDYVLIEGNDSRSLRASEEVTEYTDKNGEYQTGLWEF